MSYYLLVIMYQEKAKAKKIKIKVQNKQWWPNISLKDCDSSSKSMSLTYSSVTYKLYNWWILTILPNQRIMRLNNNRIILSDERWDQKKIRQKKKKKKIQSQYNTNYYLMIFWHKSNSYQSPLFLIPLGSPN